MKTKPTINRRDKILQDYIYTKQAFEANIDGTRRPVMIGASKSNPPGIIGWVVETDWITIEYQSIEALKSAIRGGQAKWAMTPEMEAANEI